MKRSFYEILGVAHDADQARLDAAYEAAVARLNVTTSVRGTAESVAEMKLLRDGHQLLSDHEQRVKYDAKLAADASGIQLMFFPDDKKSRRKLGIQTVIFAALAATLTGIVYYQLTKKMDEVKTDYNQALAKKQEEQSRPIVMDGTPPETADKKADKSTSETNTPAGQ
ncbi:MAG TPA: hypothetical protein VMT94_06675 [Burkholderiales bacterium]|nr:hypothetical protein [Burkholderiales bacterium]